MVVVGASRADDEVPEHVGGSTVSLSINAADLELTDEDLARVDEILPDGAFGSRYPEAMMPQW